MWEKLKAWFKYSETLLIARITTLLGVAAQVLPTVDPTLFHDLIGLRWFGVFLILWGVVTELARRRNDPDMK